MGYCSGLQGDCEYSRDALKCAANIKCKAIDVVKAKTILTKAQKSLTKTD